MFGSLFTNPKTTPRPVTIELRDGRRLRGVLKLPESMTAEQLLRRATPFLTIRTPNGDLAINRDAIAAFLLSEDATSTMARPANDQSRTAAPNKPVPEARMAFGNDPCRILRVRPGASAFEIKAAWRKRISECHPDKVKANGANDDIVAAAQRQAAQVNAAYNTLMALRAGAA